MTSLSSTTRNALAVAHLEWLRLSYSKHVPLSLVAISIVIAVAAVARYAFGAAPTTVYENVASTGFFGMLGYLIPFLFASSTISEEVVGRTLPFLTSRPVPRWTILLGKLLVTSLGASSLLFVSMLITYGVIFATQGQSLLTHLPLALQQATSLSLLATCYCAMCLFWGSVAVEAAGVATAVYLATVEFGAGYILPGAAKLVSFNTHARKLANLPDNGFFAHAVLLPDVPQWVWAATLLAGGLIFGLMAAWVFQWREYTSDRA